MNCTKIIAEGATSWDRMQWWREFEKRRKPASPKKAAANRAALISDPDIQRLMPLSVLSLRGELPADVDYRQLHAEDVAYGDWIIEHGCEGDGIFQVRARAAANAANAEIDRICSAIENFDLELFIQGITA